MDGKFHGAKAPYESSRSGCDGTLFFAGWREPYIADPTPDPTQNLIFYRSPVHDAHFRKMDPGVDPAGEPIFYRLRAPPCKLINPDPCRIHHTFHVSDIGSIRIHVADPCRNPSFYRSKKAPRVHFFKILIKARADPDPTGERRKAY